MAWKNIDERRETIGKVLSAGIEIGSREAKVLSVLYSCSPSAILADAKVVKAPQHGREIRPQAGPGDAEGVRHPRCRVIARLGHPAAVLGTPWGHWLTDPPPGPRKVARVSLRSLHQTRPPGNVARRFPVHFAKTGHFGKNP